MKTIISFITAALMCAIMGGAISYGIGTPAAHAPITIALFALSLLMPSNKGVLSVTFTEGLCEKVQTTMINLFKSNAPELARTQLGYVQALMSPLNMSGMEIIPIDQGNGKTRSVRIVYIQRGTDDDIITTKPVTCSTDNEPAPFETIVSIDKYIGKSGLKFTELEMRKLCEPDSMYMARVINAQLDALTKDLDKKLIVVQSSNFGAFEPALVDPGLWKDVQMLNASSNYAPIYYGESTVLEDFTNIGYTGKPFVIGAGNLSHYIRQVGIGCCNDNGIDLSQGGNLYYFHDLYVNSLIGTNHFIAMKPGSVQLITKNDYVGVYAKESNTFSHGTLTDPFTGITWDIKWHYDDCADFWSVQIGLNYKQYFMPANIFASDDDLYGVNGVLHYRAMSSSIVYS